MLSGLRCPGEMWPKLGLSCNSGVQGKGCCPQDRGDGWLCPGSRTAGDPEGALLPSRPDNAQQGHKQHIESPEQVPRYWQRGSCSLSRDCAVSRQQAALQPNRLDGERILSWCAALCHNKAQEHQAE